MISLGLGFVRLLLIIALINFYSPNETHVSLFFSGPIAIQLSFILTGFYMDMIYSKYKNAISFYLSRIIRIYPCYWLALFAQTSMQNLKVLYFYVPIDSKIQGKYQFLISFVNLFIFGKDDVYFLSCDSQSSCHLINKNEKSQFSYYLKVFPSWSLSTVMKFYLIVPILAKLKTPHLVLAFFCTFLITSFCFTVFHLNYDPYSNKFFFFNLTFLITGQLIYRFYSRYINLINNLNVSSYPIIFFSMILIFYDLLFFYLGHYFLHMLLILALPYIFHLTRNSVLDRKLGEYVHFMFVWHSIISTILKKCFPALISFGHVMLAFEVLFGLLFAILYDVLIQNFLNTMFKPKYVDKRTEYSQILSRNDDNDLKDSIEFMQIQKNLS